MKIAITGASGFVGSAIVQRLARDGHSCVCWRRQESLLSEELLRLAQWQFGILGDPGASDALVAGCDAVVHAALDRPATSFRQAGDHNVLAFAETNILGTLQLIEAARRQGVPKFVMVSTGAVHENVLDDRPLDEAHPRWPTTHYGAHKAALEMFVHSYGWGHSYDISAVRPCSVYGVRTPLAENKWFPLVDAVVREQPVTCRKGGKVVHADDVAAAITLLLHADGTAGQVYNCCDQYVSEYRVATLVKEITGSPSAIEGLPTSARHTIDTSKLQQLGMTFGGESLLRSTLSTMIDRLARDAPGRWGDVSPGCAGVRPCFRFLCRVRAVRLATWLDRYACNSPGRSNPRLREAMRGSEFSGRMATIVDSWRDWRPLWVSESHKRLPRMSAGSSVFF